MTAPVRIVSFDRFVARATPEAAADVVSGIEEIFFETAGPRVFSDASEREAFHDRWLGRYLRHLPDLALVALREEGGGADDAARAPEVAGYLVGAVRDPARDPMFADIPYFPLVADLTPAFPAHLHINLAEGSRGQGLGGRLVARFAALARVRGAAGLHVVTGVRSRNRSFYRGVGLAPVRELSWAGGSGVMMAARLPLKPSRPA